MRCGQSWSRDDDDELRFYWLAGNTDAEIAEMMGRTPDAIGSRRGLLGYTNSHQSQKAQLTTAVFPRFEDISKTEARRITATTPPSGKFSRQPNTSGMTCTSILVMES